MAQKDYLSESGGVAVVDDMPLEDKEAIDEFNFLSEESDWKPNREKLESMKNQLVQDRRRKRPPRNVNVRIITVVASFKFCIFWQIQL